MPNNKGDLAMVDAVERYMKQREQHNTAQGRTRDVQLIARNEILELDARRSFYDSLVGNDALILRMCTQIARKGLPGIFLLFTVTYFALGIHYRGI